MKRMRTVTAMVCINFFIYGLLSLYYSFVPLYLGERFDEVRAGFLMALGPVIIMFASVLWGRISDKARYKNTVLALITVMAAVFVTALCVGNGGFIYTAVMIAGMMFFMAPFNGLVDNITLELSASSGVKYGPVRVFGTLGFGVIALVTGFIPGASDNALLVSFLVTAAIAVAAVFAAPRVEGHDSSHAKMSSAGAEDEKPEKKPSITVFFKDRSLCMMFIICSVLMFCWSYYQNFMPTYMTDTLGIPTSIWGINVLVTVLGEVIFFLLYDKIMKRFGIRSLIFVTVLLSVIRYVLFAFITSAALILLNGLVTGAWITISTYCCTYYIDLTVDDRLRASGQTLIYTVTYGVPKVLAGLLGGVMTSALGFKISSVILAVLCLLCMIPALFVRGRKRGA